MKKIFRYQAKKSVTLIELVLVVILIGVLATLGHNRFSTAAECARVREAKSNLLLIRTAQEIYRAKRGNYYPSTNPWQADHLQINTDLDLGLNTGSHGLMHYRCQSTPPNDIYTCWAHRKRTPTSGWNNSLWYVVNVSTTPDVFICQNNTGTCPTPCKY